MPRTKRPPPPLTVRGRSMINIHDGGPDALVDANKFINKHTIVECGGYGEMHPRCTRDRPISRCDLSARHRPRRTHPRTRRIPTASYSLRPSPSRFRRGQQDARNFPAHRRLLYRPFGPRRVRRCSFRPAPDREGAADTYGARDACEIRAVMRRRCRRDGTATTPRDC